MDLADDRYGSDWADDYDTVTPIPPEQTEKTVSFLARLAGQGPVLELAAGTGRLALPLADRGLDVTALDVSAPMLAKLRAKDPAGKVTTLTGSMTNIPGERRYQLIFCVYNSITCLTSQDEQVQFLQSAAGHLADGGVLVLESMLIDPATFRHATPLAMTGDALMARFGTYSVLTHMLEQHVLLLRPGQPVSLRPVSGRLVTPAELDLMARLAGLRARARYSNWDGAPLTGPGNFINVYEQPGRGRLS